MRFVPVYISVLLLSGGAGWSAFLLKNLRRADVCSAVLGIVLALALLAYMVTGRKEKGAWVRFGLYGAAMMICAASIWMEILRPVLAVTSFREFAGKRSGVPLETVVRLVARSHAPDRDRL